MLHFAYGSNMDRAVMRRHAPAAEPLGAAVLVHHRFVITADGYASVLAGPGHAVHGVLWRLTPRDRITLDVWENVAAGHYRPAMLPVRGIGETRPALVYLARRCRTGRAKAGYMELVLAAARAWPLPAAYIESLRFWLPLRPRGAGSRNLKEFGWN